MILFTILKTLRCHFFLSSYNLKPENDFKKNKLIDGFNLNNSLKNSVKNIIDKSKSNGYEEKIKKIDDQNSENNNLDSFFSNSKKSLEQDKTEKFEIKDISFKVEDYYLSICNILGFNIITDKYKLKDKLNDVSREDYDINTKKEIYWQLSGKTSKSSPNINFIVDDIEQIKHVLNNLKNGIENHNLIENTKNLVKIAENSIKFTRVNFYSQKNLLIALETLNELIDLSAKIIH